MRQYKLPNGEFCKDGDKLVLVNSEPLFSKTEYLVRFEGDRWVIKFNGNFPATYLLDNHAYELKLKTKP